MTRSLADLRTRPHAVYLFYGEGDEVLYVGSTSNLSSRFRSHQTQQPWWGDVRRIETLRWFDGAGPARQVERELILGLAPRYNRNTPRAARPVAVEKPNVIQQLVDSRHARGVVCIYATCQQCGDGWERLEGRPEREDVITAIHAEFNALLAEQPA